MSFLNQLEAIIADRIKNPSEKSYTSTLFSSGLDRICKKIGEEAGEVIIAAKNNDSNELANESADLIYHLLVLLKKQGLDLNTVEEVLVQRHQQQ